MARDVEGPGRGDTLTCMSRALDSSEKSENRSPLRPRAQDRVDRQHTLDVGQTVARALPPCRGRALWLGPCCVKESDATGVVLGT